MLGLLPSGGESANGSASPEPAATVAVSCAPLSCGGCGRPQAQIRSKKPPPPPPLLPDLPASGFWPAASAASGEALSPLRADFEIGRDGVVCSGVFGCGEAAVLPACRLQSLSYSCHTFGTLPPAVRLCYTHRLLCSWGYAITQRPESERPPKKRPLNQEGYGCMLVEFAPRCYLAGPSGASALRAWPRSAPRARPCHIGCAREPSPAEHRSSAPHSLCCPSQNRSPRFRPPCRNKIVYHIA